MPTAVLQRRVGRPDRWRVRWQSGDVKIDRTFTDQAAAEQLADTLGSTSRSRYTDHRDRIQQNIAIGDGGCWNWQRYVSADGYGYLTVPGATGRRRVTAHRTAYEAFVGPVPDGLQLDHLCRNRQCCNPSHLEPVTPRTNILRSPVAVAAVNAAKTRCPQGHPYSEENTIRQRQGGRLCRTCQSAPRRNRTPVGAR